MTPIGRLLRCRNYKPLCSLEPTCPPTHPVCWPRLLSRWGNPVAHGSRPALNSIPLPNLHRCLLYIGRRPIFTYASLRYLYISLFSLDNLDLADSLFDCSGVSDYVHAHLCIYHNPRIIDYCPYDCIHYWVARYRRTERQWGGGSARKNKVYIIETRGKSIHLRREPILRAPCLCLACKECLRYRTKRSSKLKPLDFGGFIFVFRPSIQSSTNPADN